MEPYDHEQNEDPKGKVISPMRPIC